MFYSVTKEMFSHLFGNCNPVAINDWPNLLQVKYRLADIDSKMIYAGLLRLRKMYQKSEYQVRVLFVYPDMLQVIIGTREEVSKLCDADFMITVV